MITRREIAERFATETVFFSTFGGNPVSVAAALAVLDVLDDERVLARVTDGRRALRDAIREVAAALPGDRATSAAWAWPSASRSSRPARRSRTRPPRARSRRACESRGVLVGTSGAAGNILKVRPPLAFTTTEVPIFLDALEGALSGR